MVNANLKMDQFGGLLPAWEKTLLPIAQGAQASNTDVFSGSLQGWRKPKLLRELTNTAAAFVYRIPTVTQELARVNLIMIANANQGDTFKVGEEVYLLTATVTDPYDVKIGATATDTAANIFAALTEGDGAGTVYGTGTAYNPSISNAQDINTLDSTNIGGVDYPWIMLAAADYGAASNTIAVAESTANARLSWLSGTNSLAATTTRFTGGRNPSFDNRITGVAKWLEFEDPDTKVMKSQIVDDQFKRYYVSSPSLPPTYNTYDRINADEDFWLLGVPAPGCQPAVEIVGGGSAVTLGFGSTTETAAIQYNANTVYLTPITPTAALDIESISFMPTEALVTGSYVGVLYSDDGTGAPFELLAVTDVTAGEVVALTPVLMPFINPTGLNADTPYWIGFMGDTSVQVLRGDGLDTAVLFPNTYTNGVPTTAPGVQQDQANLQVYANGVAQSVLASRAYVYTWVTEYGEEGPPSPFTLVNGWNNGVWTVAMFTPPPDDMGVLRNITKTRIYRTIVGATGLATYFFVAEIDVAVETYVDTDGDDVVALNNQLQSTSWFPPPPGLHNIVSMANGMSVGFRGNEVWFSEPYRPHAWPPGYVVTTEFPIVGLGVIGQSCVVCTESNPYVLTGVNPVNMSSDKLTLAAPCTSAGSIVQSDNGIAYHSPDGLIQVNNGGAISLTTDLWVTREKWHTLTPPSTIRAITMPTGYYLGFGTVDAGDTTYAQTGFCLEIAPADAPSFAVLRHPGKNRIGFVPLTAPGEIDVKNVLLDPWSGIGLLVQGDSVYYYDFEDQVPDRMQYRWRSKVFLGKYKVNYSAMKVFVELENAPELNPTRMEDPTDDTSWLTLDADRYGYIRVYADGVLVTVREIRGNGELMRVLSEFKADTWQFEVLANVPIYSIQIAQSAKALRYL